MKLIKDIITIFIILFTFIIASGLIFILFKSIFVTFANLFLAMLLVLLLSFVYSLGRLIIREFK